MMRQIPNAARHCCTKGWRRLRRQQPTTFSCIRPSLQGSCVALMASKASLLERVQGAVGDAPTASETRLEDWMRSMILMRGPMTLADWMKTCLSHPQFGYYMTRDVFGTRGDFITSPEISQLFGELVGVWLVATLQQQMAAHWADPAGGEAAQKFVLIEVGPGRGTLAHDCLRVLSRFPALSSRLVGVHLVETSPALRGIQARTLKCSGVESSGEAGGSVTPPSSAVLNPDSPCAGVPVYWHDRLGDVPLHGGRPADGTGKEEADAEEKLDALPSAGPPPFTLYLAHELFDALPVHQLVWTIDKTTGKGAWRERLVDTDNSEQAAGQGNTGQASSKQDQPVDGFRLVLANTTTPASAAYTAWLQAGKGDHAQAQDAIEEGTVAEFSPASIDLARQLATRLSSTGGAGLVVDYGYSDELGVDGQPRQGQGKGGLWTLRGIKKHTFVPFLSDPGHVDLSIDVDFSALGRAAQAVDNDVAEGRQGPGQDRAEGQGEAGPRYRVSCFGPMTQGEFLQRMGLGARLQRLLSSPAAAQDPTVRSRLVSEATRLASPQEMGAVYKVMAMRVRKAVWAFEDGVGLLGNPRGHGAQAKDGVRLADQRAGQVKMHDNYANNI